MQIRMWSLISAPGCPLYVSRFVVDLSHAYVHEWANTWLTRNRPESEPSTILGPNLVDTKQASIAGLFKETCSQYVEECNIASLVCTLVLKLLMERWHKPKTVAVHTIFYALYTF